MRRPWLAKLQRPYSVEELTRTSEQRVAARLDVYVSELYELAKAVLDDLDVEHFGISWWVPLVPTRKRILIADYLFQVVGSIQTNLTEAKVHYLESQQSLDKENDRFQKSRFAKDKEGVLLTPPRSAEDELPGFLTDLHIAGCFRASASALDCLAAAIIGVLGVDQTLIKSDWKSCTVN